jgi:hypothetical protein
MAERLVYAARQAGQIGLLRPSSSDEVLAKINSCS